MSKKRILLVDDEKDFVKITKMNLEDTGEYEVLGLDSVKDLVARVHAFKPHVILLDLVMPDFSGIEACKMLHQDRVGQAVPIIILSALNKDQEPGKASELGIVDYLVKPVEKDEIISKIKNALAHQKKGRE